MIEGILEQNEVLKDILDEVTTLKERLVQMAGQLRAKDEQILELKSELESKIKYDDTNDSIISNLTRICSDKEKKLLTGLWNLSGSKKLDLNSLSSENDICDTVMLIAKSERDPDVLLPAIGLITNLCSVNSFIDEYGPKVVDIIQDLCQNEMFDEEFDTISGVMVFCIMNMTKSKNMAIYMCNRDIISFIFSKEIIIENRNLFQNLNKIIFNLINALKSADDDSKEKILRYLSDSAKYDFIPLGTRREIASLVHGYE